MAKKKTNFIRIINQQKYLYLLLVPSIVLLFLFKYVPMYGASIAFKDFNPLLGIGDSKWVGLKHFYKLFGSPFFWRVFKNTLIINIYHLIFGFPAPIILALLLNEIKRPHFKKVVQTITYLPHFLSWVIIGGLLISLLSPNSGIIASVKQLFGIKEEVFYLVEPKYFRSILVLSGIWKGIGWGSIIYLASISGINPELYDAAKVDGAGRLSQIIHVTLPGILPTISVLLVLRFGSMLGSNFEQIFVLYSPNVYEVADVFSTYVYREGLGKANYSYTTAVGLFQSLVGFILIMTANKCSKKLGGSLW